MGKGQGAVGYPQFPLRERQGRTFGRTETLRVRQFDGEQRRCGGPPVKAIAGTETDPINWLTDTAKWTHNAQCPMPNALCPMPNSQFPNLKSKI
ncbi:MAG: hypothetical protein HC785_32135 [Calothrix sp. CSU_2_0]|nr:hypothetical protein [Calothrix sp. CSU_2_0]